MGDFVAQFVSGIFTFVQFIMYYVGIVDNLLGEVMIAAGLRDPRYQLFLYFIIFVVLATLALRTLGGFLGWFILILLVLMLLHRVVPHTTLPPGTFETPLQNAF